MKKNKLILSIATAILSLSVLLTGCKKDEKIAPNTEQKLSFNISNMVGNNAAAYNTLYQDASGRSFNLADMRYYISNIVLIKNDGTKLPINGKVLLVNPSTKAYDLGIVPVGDYKGFQFMLGLDSVANHSDPTTYSEGNPLAIQTPSIHWSWSSGYIFMKLEGLVDTSLAKTGTTNFQFFYHVGLDKFSKTVDFTNATFSVPSGSDKVINLEFDLLSVLNGIDMRTENSTHTMDNMPLAMKVSNNWPTAFKLK